MGVFKIIATPLKVVVGEETDDGGLRWLVQAPASDNFKCTHFFILPFAYKISILTLIEKSGLNVATLLPYFECFAESKLPMMVKIV